MYSSTRPRGRLGFSVTCRAAAAGLGLIATSVFAALQPVSEAPLALERNADCRFDKDGGTECLDTYRYTVLSDTGREALSRIDINYPENDVVRIERAELVQPNQKPIALDKSQIDTRTAPNPDQGFLRDKQTSLAFPNLRVGSSIIYVVRRRFAAVPSATHFSYIYDFPPSSLRYDRFHATFRADRPIRYRADRMGEFTIASSADARTLTLDLKSPRFVNYVDEPDSGDIRRYPRIVLGSSLDLQDNVGAFAKRYNDILAAPLPARASAAAAKARGLAPHQRVVALMRYLNENFRYLSDWRASERGLVPFSLAEIERHGYGDCKDLSTLLTAMLRAAGVKAEPVWVRRGAFAPAALAPTIYAVDHAIVRAEVDGAVWWLDPTNPVFAPGMVMPDVQDRWAWVLGADGRVRQDSIPLETPRAAVDAKLRQRFADGEKGSIDGTLALGGHMLMDLSISDRNEGKSSSDRAICSLIATEPGQCNVERRATGFLVPEQYTVKAHITDLRALDRNAGKFEFARPNLATLWNFFARYKRNGQLTDIHLGAPESISADMTLIARNIDGQARNCSIRSRWFDLDLDGKPASGGYRYRYGLTRKVAWVPHDDIVSAEFQKMAAQARDCVNGLRFNVQPEKS